MLRLGLAKLGIPEQERPLTSSAPASMRAAAAVNSRWPGRPIAAIDATELPDVATLTTLLHRAWREVPWEELRPAR